MTLQNQYNLLFSKGSSFIDRFLEKYAKDLPLSEALFVSKKLYTAICKKNKEITFYGIPKDLQLAYVNSQVNTGVFLKPNAKSIEAGTFIGIYTGSYELVRADLGSSTAYAYDVAQGISLTKSQLKHVVGTKEPLSTQDEYSIQTNALTTGNFTRFINHSSLKNNIEAVVGKLPDNRIEVLLFALKKIQPGEQLLSNYGGQYWKALHIIPNDMTPTSYLLNSTGKAIAGKQPPELPLKTKKLLSSLLNPIAYLPEELDSKSLIKKLKSAIPTLTKKQKKQVENFEEIILERGLPRRFDLTYGKTKLHIFLKKEEKKIPKNELIGTFAGTLSLKEENGSIPLAKTSRTILYLNPLQQANLLNKIPFGHSNIKLSLSYDKEIDTILLLAIASKEIFPGDELKLEQFTPFEIV